MDFYNAINGIDSFTENDMPTRSTSLSKVVDMFFNMGASRKRDDDFLIKLVSEAFAESPTYTLRSIFYNRDVRGGQGERRSFRVFYSWLIKKYPAIAVKYLHLIPEYGRWDDLLFVTYNTHLWERTIRLVKSALLSGNGLCAKWMPREGKKNKEIYKALVRDLRWTPKEYRKTISRLTKVVETQMCNKKWEIISYEQIPSVALKKYRKAFIKHDNTRFSNWNKKVISGESEAHADAIYPSDIIKDAFYYRELSRDNVLAMEAQWKSLPDYMPKGRKILPICDTSGSMSGDPIVIAVALSIYLSERNFGPFKDVFMTFSGNPVLHKLTGDTVYSKVKSLNKQGWQMNTDLNAVFRLILSKAVENRLSEEQMPNILLILSDMQFDQSVIVPTDSAFDMIRREYSNAGYKLPTTVFWNLRSSVGVPVKYDENGVALVSGYNPNIMKTVLNISTPVETVLQVLNSERYSRII